MGQEASAQRLVQERRQAQPTIAEIGAGHFDDVPLDALEPSAARVVAVDRELARVMFVALVLQPNADIGVRGIEAPEERPCCHTSNCGTGGGNPSSRSKRNSLVSIGLSGTAWLGTRSSRTVRSTPAPFRPRRPRRSSNARVDW